MGFDRLDCGLQFPPQGWKYIRFDGNRAVIYCG